MNHDSPTTAYEIKAAVDDLARAFEQHEQTHAELEQAADPLLEEKLSSIDGELSRLQKRLDQMARTAGRPPLAQSPARPDDAEHKSAFYDRYVRKGHDGDLPRLEAKALNIGVEAEGGYAVPESLDRAIDRLLKDVSPIRNVAKLVAIGSANYKKLITVSGTASGWVGETDSRPETASPQFAEVAPPLGEIYANPAATQAMLDDGFFDVENWLAEELAIEFGAKEGAAFIAGDGINKPKGFLTYPTASSGDEVRPFGTIQHIATGVAGNFPASNPADLLVDLVHALRPAHRQGASFVMNTGTMARIRKFKDGDGNYLWRPGLGEATGATLLGFPVIEAEDMPNIAADSLAVAFGNFNHGYTVTERQQTRILRDPFSNKPFVHFYATKRIGGGVINSQAIKLLKFSLS